MLRIFSMVAMVAGTALLSYQLWMLRDELVQTFARLTLGLIAGQLVLFCLSFFLWMVAWLTSVSSNTPLDMSRDLTAYAAQSLFRNVPGGGLLWGFFGRQLMYQNAGIALRMGYSITLRDFLAQIVAAGAAMILYIGIYVLCVYFPRINRVVAEVHLGATVVVCLVVLTVSIRSLRTDHVRYHSKSFVVWSISAFVYLPSWFVATAMLVSFLNFNDASQVSVPIVGAIWCAYGLVGIALSPVPFGARRALDALTVYFLASTPSFATIGPIMVSFVLMLGIFDVVVSTGMLLVQQVFRRSRRLF